MTIKNFIKELQNIATNTETDISDFEIRIELDYCLNPEKIHYSADFIEKTITITKGACGF